MPDRPEKPPTRSSLRSPGKKQMISQKNRVSIAHHNNTNALLANSKQNPEYQFQLFLKQSVKYEIRLRAPTSTEFHTRNFPANRIRVLD